MASAKLLRTRLIFQISQVVGIPFVFHRQNADSPQNIYACDYKDDPCLVNNGRMFQDNARGEGACDQKGNKNLMTKNTVCKVEGGPKKHECDKKNGGCTERSILDSNDDDCCQTRPDEGYGGGCRPSSKDTCGEDKSKKSVCKMKTPALDITSSCEVKRNSCGAKKEKRTCGGGKKECDEKYNDIEDAVLHALKRGYRLIHLDDFEGNESEVGRAIAKSGVPREEIFIVTKLWTKGYEECKKAFNNSLKNLDTDYVDLYLIHVPLGGLNCESYDAMVELQKEGCIRSIGVANFGVCHLQELEKAGKPTPEVNQIELHCFCKQTPIVDYCKKNNITVMGYRPLAKGKFFNHPCIKEMAQKYKKDEAQIMLRWSVQKGYVTIPRAHQVENIETNAAIFDFCLSDKDMKTLDQLPDDPVTENPVNAPWEG